MERMLVFRNLRSGNWNIKPGDPLKIHPRDTMGYRYWRSFGERSEAEKYCQQVEIDERDLRDAARVLSHNDNLNQLAFD